MTSTQTTTTTSTFPSSGRPVLWWPQAKELLLVMLAAVALLGFPPAAPAEATVNGLPEDWLRPVEAEVVENFAAPPAPWASGHRGVDLAAAGEPVRAPADGVISFSGTVVNREVLSIDHGAGLVSSFEPVETDLEAGDTVTSGAPVAQVGTYDGASHHCDERPCLHWGVRLHGKYINPLLLTGDLEPSVLLPLND